MWPDQQAAADEYARLLADNVGAALDRRAEATTWPDQQAAADEYARVLADSMGGAALARREAAPAWPDQQAAADGYARLLAEKMGTQLQRRQDDNNFDNYTFPAYSKVSAGGEAGIIVGTIVFLAIVGVLGFFVYGRLRARKLGVPAPSLNPFSDANRVAGARSGGVVGWLKDKVGSAQRRRTAGGAYEGNSMPGGAVGLSGPMGGAGGRTTRSQRAFGGLDPDEAWDARVGTEANGYGYEEQELGLRAQPPAHLDEDTGYGGARYGHVSASRDTATGRSELDDRYDAEVGRGGPGKGRNPFDDAEESNMSLREVSPRHSRESSATVERKSAFKEVL